MSPAASKIKEKFNPIPCHNEMRTKIWGVKCETGLRYKQIGMKKYCITQAVLEPNPYMKDSGNFVSVMVVHDKGEHLMAVLRHGQIYQVNLNMPIDRDKNVAFYLVGRGTVYLLGYEVILPKKNRETKSSPLSLEVHSDHSASEESDSSSFETTSQKHSKSLESEKKKKKPAQQAVKEYSVRDAEDDDDSQSEESDHGSSETTSQKHPKSLKSGKKKKKSAQQETPVTSAVQMSDDDSSEEDPDFSEDEDEFKSSESEDSIESEEVEVDKSEVEDLVAETEDPEPISASKKRKLLLELQLNLKRPKIDKLAKSSASNKVIEIEDSDEEASLKEDSSSREENSSKEDGPSLEDSAKELSESGAAGSCNGTEKDSEPEILDNSVEKKKKKKKKKKKAAQDTVETPKKTNKVLLNKSSSNKTPNVKIMANGLEIQDLKIGHGPVASRGKMVHVFFVGRLPDKSIFESCVPGKKPLSFILGANNALKGLEVGIEGMKTGGKRKITVPPSMGYGNKVVEGVPPNSTLSFLVELQAVS